MGSCGLVAMDRSIDLVGFGMEPHFAMEIIIEEED